MSKNDWFLVANLLKVGVHVVNFAMQLLKIMRRCSGAKIVLHRTEEKKTIELIKDLVGTKDFEPQIMEIYWWNGRFL